MAKQKGHMMLTLLCSGHICSSKKPVCQEQPVREQEVNPTKTWTGEDFFEIAPEHTGVWHADVGLVF